MHNETWDTHKPLFLFFSFSFLIENILKLKAELDEAKEVEKNENGEDLLKYSNEKVEVEIFFANFGNVLVRIIHIWK